MSDNNNLLSSWFTPEDEEAAKGIIGPCPREILQMVAVLVNMEISARDNADDLVADGFVFKAEEAQQRADSYRASIDCLVDVWGIPEDAND